MEVNWAVREPRHYVELAGKHALLVQNPPDEPCLYVCGNVNRTRKIKCDGARPRCLRCSSSGRTCEGYTQVSQSKQIQIWHSEQQYHEDFAVIELERALATLIANAEEKRALYYFREKAAPVLSGSLDSDFWSRLVLQVGDSEPAVRLAIMAVGSLFEHMQYQGSDSPTKDSQAAVTGRRYQFAIQCYNKAIAALIKRLELQDSSEDIALLTCVLFIYVEFLQGNDAEALALCVKGSKVLHNMQSAVSSSPGSTSQPLALLSDRSGIIAVAIVPIFTRLEILSFLFEQPIETPTHPLKLTDATPPELDYSFTTLAEARIALYELMETCQQVIGAARMYKWGPQGDSDSTLFIPPSGLSALHSRVLSNLANWSLAFTSLTSLDLPLPLSSPSSSTTYATTLLHLYHLITHIWISTVLDPSETVIDAHLPAFESIILLSSLILSPTTATSSTTPPPPRPPPHFTFEMGFIPPLYFTAINCRHPLLRRQAVNLIHAGSKCEGLWDAEPIARIAERVIELEESGGNTATLGTNTTSTWTEKNEGRWPEEKHRVHDAAIGKKVMGGERQGYPVEFRLRPWGSEGGFEFINDFIRTKEECWDRFGCAR